MASEAGKEAAGRHAATFVEDGMKVGLGTGSTAYYAVVAIGERGLDITAVATSEDTEDLAAQYGIRVVDPGDVDHLDVDIDGADEIDAQLNLVKGGGGAHAREKVVAALADRFYVIADDSKPVDKLCATRRLPVEALGFAEHVVARELTRLGARDVSRREKLSDNGNPILDAAFDPLDDPAALDATLNAMPGIVEHGIFLRDMVYVAIIGSDDGSVRTMTKD